MFTVHGTHSKLLIPVALSSVAFITFINRSRHSDLSSNGLFHVNHFIIYFNTRCCLSCAIVPNVYSSLNARSCDYDIDLVHWRLINGCSTKSQQYRESHAIICQHFILYVYNLSILKYVYFEVVGFWEKYKLQNNVLYSNLFSNK